MNDKNLSQLPALLIGLNDQVPSHKNFFIGESSITYGQFRQQVDKTRGLLQRLKIEAADRVAVSSLDKITVAAICSACIMEGVAAVILDPNASISEVTILLNRASPKLAFLDQAITIDLGEIQDSSKLVKIIPVVITEPKRTAFSLLIRNKSEPLSKLSYPGLLKEEHPVSGCIDISQDTPALIIFTSGTSSRPKGVVLNHLNLESQLNTFIRQFNLNLDSKLVNHLPLHHTDGLNQGPLLALATGATWIAPVFTNINDAANMLDTVYRERATHLITIPTVLAMMRRLPSDYDDSFSSPEFCFIESTASLLEDELWREIEQRFNVKIVNCYGLTETVSEAIYSGPDDNTRKVGTIGKPVDCEALIINQSGEKVKNGEAGELLLHGDNIMSSYFEDETATKLAFHQDWFRTGDLAVCDSDGFYKIVGRINNLIIRGGINIQPEEVSSVLLKHADVDAAITLGIEDEFLGEKVLSCITVGSTTDTEISINSLFSHCRKWLAKEKYPNDILVFDELPYGPSGKVDQAALRELIEEKERGANPATLDAEISLPEKVVAVAANVFHTSTDRLNLESNQANTDGWDSLAFLEFIMAIEKTFDFRIPPKDIMNINAIGDMVRIVMKKYSSIEHD